MGGEAVPPPETVTWSMVKKIVVSEPASVCEIALRLTAGHVQLRTTRRASRMQRNHLGTNKVVAVGNASRDLEVDMPAALVHILGAPVVVVARSAARALRPRIGVHLEPAGAAVRRPSIGDLGHVDMDRTIVRSANGLGSAVPLAALLVHLDGDGVADLDGAAASDALGAVDVAADIVGRDVLDGRVGLRQTDAGLALVDAVDPKVLEGGVGGDLMGCVGRRQGENGGLHGDRLASKVERANVPDSWRREVRTTGDFGELKNTFGG